MKLCNSCHGRGGMMVDDDYQIDFEVCLDCDGYGYLNEVTDDED